MMPIYIDVFSFCHICDDFSPSNIYKNMLWFGRYHQSRLFFNFHATDMFGSKVSLTRTLSMAQTGLCEPLLGTLYFEHNPTTVKNASTQFIKKL